MRYLANILVRENFEAIPFYNIVKDESALISDIPTLIIGWEWAKSLYPQASILDWQINDNVYWTFERRVRRQAYELDTVKFKKVVFDRVVKKIGYIYLNLLTCNRDEKFEFYNILQSDDKKSAFIDNDMVYVYDDLSKIVFGVSLNAIDYGGGNRKKLLAILLNSPSIKLVKERDILSYETREMLRNRRYLIAYLGDLLV